VSGLRSPVKHHPIENITGAKLIIKTAIGLWKPVYTTELAYLALKLADAVAPDDEVMVVLVLVPPPVPVFFTTVA
jgi:hypothetical protein